MTNRAADVEIGVKGLVGNGWNEQQARIFSSFLTSFLNILPISLSISSLLFSLDFIHPTIQALSRRLSTSSYIVHRSSLFVLSRSSPRLHPPLPPHSVSCANYNLNNRMSSSLTYIEIFWDLMLQRPRKHCAAALNSQILWLRYLILHFLYSFPYFLQTKNNSHLPYTPRSICMNVPLQKYTS